MARATTLGTRDLVKSYRGRTVVNRVSVDVKRGEVVGLLGPNGAGKTTTFYMVTGIIKPQQGSVYLERGGQDIDLTAMPMHERARQGVGYLAQEASIFRKLSVEDNIMAILETMDLDADERNRRLDQLLDDFHIAHLARQKAYTLSGGERRRAEIARALVIDPDFILLDEPFVGIDPIAVADIQQMIRQLSQRDIGVLITDHNVRETLSIIDRAYLLFEGQVLMSGTARQLANDPKAREIYLGEKFQL